MANTHTTLSSLFTAIANAIRAKTGSTATIVADDFPDAITSIQTGFNGCSYKASGHFKKGSSSSNDERNGIVTKDTATGASTSLPYAYIDLNTVGEGLFFLVATGGTTAYFYPTNKSFANAIQATICSGVTCYDSSSESIGITVIMAKAVSNGTNFDIYDGVSGAYLYSGTRINYGNNGTSGGGGWRSFFAVQVA